MTHRRGSHETLRSSPRGHPPGRCEPCVLGQRVAQAPSALPLIRAGEDSAPPPPEDAQIQSLLKSLPEDQLYALILLTYVGRGDFSADHLLPAYQTMKETFPSKDLAIAQMTGKKTLAEYLTDAMEEIQKRHIDLDSLKFASTVAVS